MGVSLIVVNNNNFKQTLREGSQAMREAKQIIHEAADFPWPDCIRKMKSEGNSQESAEKICGSIKARNN